MNWLETGWTAMAAACITLALIHLATWFRQRDELAHLALFALAISVAVFGAFEVSIVKSRTPAEHAQWVRWAHVPLCAIALLFIGFVRLYFGTGRLWLACAAAGFRLAALALNFSTGVNLNFEQVDALRHTQLWGGVEIATPIGATNPWQIVAQIGNLLLVAFIADASLTLWRRGDPTSRRRALVIGGSIATSLVVIIPFGLLVVYGAVRAPTIFTPSFMIVIAGMGYELSWDMIAATQLARRLRASEARLRGSEERFRAVVDAVPNAILVVDDQGRVALANPQAEALFGHVKSSLIGRAVGSLIPERARATHEAQRAAYGADPRARSMGAGKEVFALRGDHCEVPVEVFLKPIVSAGEASVLVSMVDLTERRATEREAARQRDEIAHLSRVAMLGELGGALAHELNQPLMAILGNAQAAQRLLARDAPRLDTLAEILDDIVESDLHAGAVIKRLRSLLKKQDAQYAPLHVDDMLKDSLHLMHSDLLARQVSVDMDLALGLPAVSGDRIQLQQVMLNLLLNGCDAMEAGTGERRIVVSTRLTDTGSVEIAVRDSGGGIPPQDVERIFEPFVSTKTHGLGLGLAICRTIAEAHGGRLWAGNNVHGGATFHFELPPAS